MTIDTPKKKTPRTAHRAAKPHPAHPRQDPCRPSEEDDIRTAVREKADTIHDLLVKRLTRENDIRTAVANLRAEYPDIAIRGISLADPGGTTIIERPETWLALCDALRRELDPLSRDLLARRIAGEPYRDTCAALFLSVSHYYRLLREALWWGAVCAARLGLLTPFPGRNRIFPHAG